MTIIELEEKLNSIREQNEDKVIDDYELEIDGDGIEVADIYLDTTSLQLVIVTE